MFNKKLLQSSLGTLLIATLALAGCTTSGYREPNIVTTATGALAMEADAVNTLARLETSIPGSRELVKKANGVLIFPRVLKAGLILGGQSGDGVLKVGGRTEGFYNIQTVSVGLQAGAQTRAIVVLLMTQNSLDKIRNSATWTADAAASIAIAKVGANGVLDTGGSSADVQMFVMTNNGLMADLSVGSTKISKIGS